MRALVTDGRGGASVRDLPDPVPERGQVLVAVRATSVNRGELTRVRAAAEGWCPGWDFAGTLLTGADQGRRVVGWVGSGAWAERVLAPADQVAELPESVTFEQAAALPTAALTALRMLRVPPGALGRRVAITGASGGVGRFAVQLAHRAGARVTAIVSRPERAPGLRELGADTVVAGLDDATGPFDLVLDAVGGDYPARLATRLSERGTLVIYGNSSNQATTFGDVRDFYLGGLRRIQGFTVFNTFAADPPAGDLRLLAELVGQGALDPHVEEVRPWTEVGGALKRLAERSVGGKLVLTIDS